MLLLSWSAWLSVLLVILCCVFWANYEDGDMAAADGSIMIPVALLIYLPCLALAYVVSSCCVWAGDGGLLGLSHHICAGLSSCECWKERCYAGAKQASVSVQFKGP